MRYSRLFGAVVCLVVAAACTADESTGEAGSAQCRQPREFADEVAALIVPDMLTTTWSMTPGEATFSSPQAVDLSGDGVLDIVQGFGQDTFGARESSVIATNGATGEQIWRSTGHEDLIGSATFASLGGDPTIDVVIGGRRGALLAIDGSDGSVLWEFDDQEGRWFNFYTSQIVPDQNGDGIVDLVAVNGGLVVDQPEEGGGIVDPDKRHLGTVFVVSGVDGSVLTSVRVPDQRESYMSPVLLPLDSKGDVDVLIGTGGETLPGAVWKWPLNALMDGESGAAEQLASGDTKGVIASPVVGNMNAGCVVDIVVQAFDGTLSLLDGATGDQVWAVDNPGFETYSTPTLGYFVGDDQVPDVFASVARGVWPEYEASDYLLVDGASGQVVWRETLGTFAPSGFVAADVNGDGRDEVIFGVNDVEADTQQMYVLDAARIELHPLGTAFSQTAFSAPWLGDLDGDEKLDLVVTASSYQSSGNPAGVHRLALDWTTPDPVSWGGYLGTDGTGHLNLRAPVD